MLQELKFYLDMYLKFAFVCSLVLHQICSFAWLHFGYLRALFQIYQEVGLTKLYEELESAKAELESLENEYFEVLEIAEELE